MIVMVCFPAPYCEDFGVLLGSVGRKSSCLFCPYQGSNPDLRPPVAAGARRKLGHRLSQALSLPPFLSLTGETPVCI